LALVRKISFSLNGVVYSLTRGLLMDDPKTQMKQWEGMLYLTGNESVIFITSMGQIFEIELMDGRKGKFHATQPGHTVALQGSGPLE